MVRVCSLVKRSTNNYVLLLLLKCINIYNCRTDGLLDSLPTLITEKKRKTWKTKSFHY